jgi:3-hydroxyisobutyrate dehydrogenase
MPEQANPSVAFLGTGIMGSGMAASALRAGLSVRAWNRTLDRAQPLVEEGAEAVSSAAEAARGADLIVTMLTDGDAVLEVMEGDEGGLAGAGEEALWVQCSTIGLEGFERCAELAERAGVAFVDAPVLGTKEPAEKGELLVLASGPEDERARCEPLFDAIGQRTLWLGEAGEGTRLKLVVNSWLVAVVEGLAETVALAEGLGIEPNGFLEAIRGGATDMPYAQLKGKMMIDRSFEPSFPLRLAAKDARLVVEAAERQELDLPLTEAIARRMEQGVKAGHGDDDMAATFRTSAPGAD